MKKQDDMREGRNLDIVGVAGSIPAAPTIALAKSCCAFRGRIHLMFWNVRGRRV
jgi:hypothetical protein